MKIATPAIGLVIRTLVMAAAISSPLRRGAICYELAPMPAISLLRDDHSLGLKQVLLIRTQFPGLSDQQNAGGLPDCDGAGKAALRQFFLRQDRYERDR